MAVVIKADRRLMPLYGFLQQRGQRPDILGRLAKLPVPPPFHPVDVHDRGFQLFRAVTEGFVLKIGEEGRARHHGVNSQLPQGSRIGLGDPLPGPGALPPAGGGLHHPEILPALDPTGKGEGRRHILQVGMAQIGVFVHRHHIQLPERLIVIHAAGPRTGGVGGDGQRTVGAENLPLLLGEGNHGVAAKPLEIQPQGGVVEEGIQRIFSADLDCPAGHGDLVEALIGLAPEDGSGAAVEFLHGPVFLLEPVLEFPGAGRAMAPPCRLLGQLVVDMPSQNVGIALQSADKLLHYPAAVGPVNVAVVAIVAAAAEGASDAAIVHISHLRMPLTQPDGRTGAGGADDGGNPFPSQDVDYIREPLHMKFPLPRLQKAPCEFADAHHVEALLPQPGGIPQHLLPCFLFRIIIRSIIPHSPIPLIYSPAAVAHEDSGRSCLSSSPAIFSPPAALQCQPSCICSGL